MSRLCRDCLTLNSGPQTTRCPACKGGRVRTHSEIETLTIAHIDCDAFYASVEKRDRPELRDRPVIVGGGQRGVVSTACYVARSYGVRSAMPMFKALKACPQAVVIKPDMNKYAHVARLIRTRMLALTPLVEPLSLDEAFLDLSGTERLHKHCPAVTLAQLALDIEREIGVTISAGLSFNKLLAKIASELDKPRGFAVIGRADAKTFLKGQPVSIIPGVGPRMAQALGRAGFVSVGDIQAASLDNMMKTFGSFGGWLFRLANADDTRPVSPGGERKSVSAETTFASDHRARDVLIPILWRLCERVSARAKSAEIGGRTVVLKLKTADFQSLTRRAAAPSPTQSAQAIFDVASRLLTTELKGQAYRLIGVGLADLVAASECDQPDLFAAGPKKALAAERAIDAVRAKFGAKAIGKGRGIL
ncbi:MAG TPA: DNA polymerase IV [Alphaproteobacteria bacterium]|nr:DNA polymerase IV [Alphaproteobacteria bacterium]HAJ48235.1 DNA polymerase IV [Alphaproteobacteria bacterium]